MATSATPGILTVTTKPCAYSSCKVSKPGTAIFISSWPRLNCSSQISSAPFFQNFPIISAKPPKFVTKALSEASNNSPLSGLPIDLRGKRAFIAGVADDNGYGWAIAKSLAAAGAEILVGTWVPALNIFESSLQRGKFDESRTLRDGSLMEITKVYPLDAVYDCPEDVPEDVKTNKRYAGSSNWTVKEVAECVKQDFGSIDILVHSLANGPEVGKPILETSRNGYLAAISASSYSFVSLLQYFAPIMNPGGATISLSFIASERIMPGYGGGMSTAKAALESDTRMLAFEAGRKNQIRVNSISAGPLKSRAAKAIGSKGISYIDRMIDYSRENAPLQKELSAEEVGDTAAFLASPLASAITGAVIYVDNGLNAMGMGVDSPVFADFDIPRSIPKST
ncbi:enoyl-[acyl-carrier-protein] reductase [NADH], chloroplastic-like [Rhododendron vialii]|uniref:enoyl-[acyl-carrier-protein] reductase [NADH], chloroplastic-like n=1 Tax=Rhododendron vialii TaxID=182163 RepID=UPI00265F3C1B|nr:enoyl-[acyl-carrier-protein] reductase [NADH], chloroplastic-like [Rhododendron vialii]XP_058210301.1 enoyl-[acyl-carrier-protein] reductase [NADH], chloroplastic-like [Rhododendron vialii]XP_058210302.1 enoyl-[acyl-carrier-protein] reductase [NADH], chloroplastic-like [Rhododendron vialii]